MKNLKDFTDAMHAAAKKDVDKWGEHNVETLLSTLASESQDLDYDFNDDGDSEEIRDRAIHLALIAAEIARRVKP